MKTFAFGPDFQRSLLRLLMTDDAFWHKAMKYLEPGFFTTRPHGWMFATMQKYHLEYAKRITEIPLREAAARDAGFLSEVEATFSTRVTEPEFIKDQLKEFVRRNIFARAHEESQKFYNDGKHSKAYDMMCEAMDDLRRVEFDEPDRSWFFDELESRMRRRFKDAHDPTEGVYTTGIEQVDDMLDGGPKRGEVHLVIGNAKAGKTIFLINQGFVITRVCRKPVLYINLEGSTKLIEDRLDSCYSTELYTAVKRGEIRPALYKEMVEEYRYLRGLMVIRTLNDWDVNILSLEAELKELESDGFRPEVIVLDYVDLLRSRNRVDTETQNQVDSMKDVKRLANRGYLIWSACQAQRMKDGDDERETLLKASNIADAYGKIRIADGWGSINSTRAERERGESRYFLENYRDGAVGRVFRLHNENDRMRIAVTSEEVHAPAPPAAGTPPTTTSSKRRSPKTSK